VSDKQPTVAFQLQLVVIVEHCCWSVAMKHMAVWHTFEKNAHPGVVHCASDSPTHGSTGWVSTIGVLGPPPYVVVESRGEHMPKLLSQVQLSNWKLAQDDDVF
jgi:hypothetical protein